MNITYRAATVHSAYRQLIAAKNEYSNIIVANPVNFFDNIEIGSPSHRLLDLMQIAKVQSERITRYRRNYQIIKVLMQLLRDAGANDIKERALIWEHALHTWLLIDYETRIFLHSDYQATRIITHNPVTFEGAAASYERLTADCRRWHDGNYFSNIGFVREINALFVTPFIRRTPDE